MGGFNGRSPLPETGPNVYSACQREVQTFSGGVGGVAPGLDQVTTHISVPQVPELWMAFGVANVW